MRPPDPDDADLIERSWHDPEAFAGLYDRHAARLHRYVARRLGDGHADDIVADTFLDAFRRRHRYDLTVSDARPWLYGIAANLIGKHGRAEVRMLRAYARTGADPVLAGTTSSTDEAEGITDAAGAPAIGVSDDGGYHQLLLDPVSYQVIGLLERSTESGPKRAPLSPKELAKLPKAEQQQILRKMKTAPPELRKGTVVFSVAYARVSEVSGPGVR